MKAITHKVLETSVQAVVTSLELQVEVVAPLQIEARVAEVPDVELRVVEAA